MNTHELLNTLVQKRDVTAKDAQVFLAAVMAGTVSPALTGAILTALRMKEESVPEITGFVRAMRAHMLTIRAPGAVDIVGTGGDGSGSFNISTAAAFVVAGAGVSVAKHGNRAASSKCGSADVLETLGVNIMLSPQQAEKVYKRAGIVFLFAPAYHPATKEVVVVRKELKIRTIFNVLGPFVNPASVCFGLIGVANGAIQKKMTAVAKGLGYKHLLIVTSDDGMDEVSVFAKTRVNEIRGRTARSFVIDPAKLGFARRSKKDILGGDATKNATMVRDVLKGKKGAPRDVVVLNAACALYAADAVKTIKEGIARAEQSIDKGHARGALMRLIDESQACI